jgi:hypothetical protein
MGLAIAGGSTAMPRAFNGDVKITGWETLALFVLGFFSRQ